MANHTSKLGIFIWTVFGFILGAAITAGVIKFSGQEGAGDEQAKLLTYQGQDYGVEQLPPALAQQYQSLDEQLYQQRMVLLQQAALELHIAREARERKLPERDVAAELFDGVLPSNEEIERFYAENQSEIKRPLNEVRDMIRDFLIQQRRGEILQSILGKLTQDNQLEFHLTPPATPTTRIDTTNRPAKGEPSAPITVIEFADYQCPHCKTASQTLGRLVEEHPEQVQLVYMDFPLNSSGISRRIAEGAYCANQQDQFWPYHDLAFASQSQLNQESPVAFARQLELDLPAFETCLSSDEARQYVQSSEQQALKLGLRATPAIFINGQRFQGPDLQQSLEQAVLGAAGAQ